MAEPTWGLLAKAQDDEQTINEAINEAIADHEADPDAHTGAGESLETHKAQEVVDHPAGSIVADKQSDIETIVKCVFESLDGWSQSGNVSLGEIFTAYLYIEYGVVDLSKIYGTVVYPGHFLNYSKDILIQSTFWIDEDTDTTVYFLLGGYISDVNLSGFGYQIINGVVKGFWGDGASPTFTSDLSIDATIPHVYRVLYNGTEKSAKFYIDGVLKATIDDIEPVADFEPLVYFSYEATDTADGNMKVKNLIISRQI